MNKKELRAFYGHRFPTMTKPKTKYENENLTIFTDRSGQVMKIISNKSLDNKYVEYCYNVYTGEQWLQRMNWDFRGQPLEVCADSITKMFEMMREAS